MCALFQEPVRGIRGYSRWKPGCSGTFADITVDFEPSPSFEFISSSATGEIYPPFIAAAVKGICRELLGHVESWEERLPEAGPESVAVRVVLLHAREHEVDSSEFSFERAGRLAVRAAVEVLRERERQRTA